MKRLLLILFALTPIAGWAQSTITIPAGKISGNCNNGTVPPFLCSTVGTGSVPLLNAFPFLTPEWQGLVADVQVTSQNITTAGTTTLTVPTGVFAPTDCQTGTGCTGTGNKTIIIEGAGADLYAGANTGTITPGSGYVNGTYNFVPLTCISCSSPLATQAYATITVSGGAVTAINTSPNAGQEGYFYKPGDTLTTPNTFLGGMGSGFVWTLTTTAQAPLMTTIVGYTSSTSVTLNNAMNSHLSSNTCGGTTCQVFIKWGMASGAGGVNDAGAKINAAWATNPIVILNKGYYAIGTTLVPPSNSSWGLFCEPGAILVAMNHLTGADPAMQNIPYNAMLVNDYPPTVSSGGSFGTGAGATISNCTFDQALVAKDGIVNRSFKLTMLNDFVNNGWGGTVYATGPGSNVTDLNHGQGSQFEFLNFNNGATTLPGQGTAASQQIAPAHCYDITDTDTQITSGYCNAYGDSSVKVSGANTMTATTTNGSPNLVVSSMTSALHIGDRITDSSSYISGGQGLIPAGTYIISGPVNGMATPFFTTTITSGSASMATSTQALVAGEEIKFVAGGSGSTAMGTITGINPGQVYYVNSTGLSTTTVQVCIQPSCSGGSITPAGGGTATPIGQGMYTGTSGTFVMSANATGTSSGNDTVKAGEIIVTGGCSGTGANTCFVGYGGSAPHFLDFHSFQASGATPYGPCWQLDVSAAMLPATDQCDNQAAIQDGVNLRYASDFVSGFFSNLGTSYYVGQIGVRIDPSINSNPGQITVIGTLQQGYSGNNARLFQDNSSGKNNLCLEAGPTITTCGTQTTLIANDNGVLATFTDCGGACNNSINVTPSIAGVASGMTIKSQTPGVAADLAFPITAATPAAGSNLPGGAASLSGGNGDPTAADNQGGGAGNLNGGNGLGTATGGGINITSGPNCSSQTCTLPGTGASGDVNIKANGTGATQGKVAIGVATTGLINIATGASTGAVHIDDNGGTGTVFLGNSADVVSVGAPFRMNNPLTFSTLAACAAGTKGQLETITDGAASPTYMASAAGGGSVFQLVLCNGTNWINH